MWNAARWSALVILIAASVDAQTATVRVAVDRAALWRRNPSVIVATCREGQILEVVGREMNWFIVRVPPELGGKDNTLAFISAADVREDSGTVPSGVAGSQGPGAAGTPDSASGPSSGWGERGFVSINGGYQATSTTFNDNVTITRFAEEGDIDVNYKVKTGLAVDVSGGALLWKSLGVGVGVSRFSASDSAAVSARIPHPFFFDAHREISGTGTGLKREELAVHVDALVLIPASKRFRVAVFGGPTFFRVTQGLVSDVTYTEAYPFDTAEFTGATVTEQTKSKIGFNVGADVMVLFARHVGVGGIVRFSRATVDFSSADGGTVSVDVGGTQAGAGLRLVF